ncbi:cystatin-A-like [Symphorus nematophorus]
MAANLGGSCGGWSETMNATKEIQKICDEVKCRVEEQTNKKYVEFKAVKYRNQIVAGEKLSIKVHVGGVNYIHLFIFLVLRGGTVLRGVEQHKTKDDPLETF